MSVTAPRWVSYVPLADLVPAKRNPRRHDLEGIIASIAWHGVADVVAVVDERTQRTLAGHGRTAALIRMQSEGYDDPHGVRDSHGQLPRVHTCPPGLIVDDDGGWLVPVLRGWSSRDDRQAEATLVGLNRTTEAAEWLRRGLADIVEDLATFDPEMLDSLAFSQAEMDGLLSAASPAALGEPDPPPQIPGDDAAAAPDGGGSTPAAAAGGVDAICPRCAHRFPLAPGS